jgi:hypothetical protein
MNDFIANVVQSIFEDRIPALIELKMNTWLQSGDNPDDTMIECLFVPESNDVDPTVRFVGPFGVDGATYGYIDIRFRYDGTVMHGRYLDTDEAIELVKLYYKVNWI